MRVSNFFTLAVVLLVPLAVVAFYFLRSESTIPVEIPTLNSEVVKIGNVVVPIEVADTEADRRKGLGGRDSLSAQSGLLFIFEEEGAHGIWMRDMLFAIDIIWISKDLRVVDIAENVQPVSFPHSFYPQKNALYVLEVNAFFIEQNGILVGDIVTMPKKYLKK